MPYDAFSLPFLADFRGTANRIIFFAQKQGIRVLVLSLVTNIVAYHPYRSAEAAVEAEISGAAEILNWDGVKEEIANHQEVGTSFSL